MPRQARLDAPGRLHHVMVRGLDRQLLFREDADREDFVARVAMLAASGAWQVYAWALLPNHLHLVVRTGAHPLARSMRSLLTGYAGAFNRRHKRTGHLVQNRYKSIIVEEEVYMLELVRYLHLNPVRALARFPWMGHSALLGAVPRPWQDTATILAQFGPTGRRPELQGGGLRRSLSGWAAVAALRRGREAFVSDERILGSSAFVEALRQEVQPVGPPPRPQLPLPALVARVCQAAGIAPEAPQQGSRRGAVARTRAGIAYLAVERCGYSGVSLIPFLGVGAPSIHKAAQRGRSGGVRRRRPRAGSPCRRRSSPCRPTWCGPRAGWWASWCTNWRPPSRRWPSTARR